MCNQNAKVFSLVTVASAHLNPILTEKRRRVCKCYVVRVSWAGPTRVSQLGFVGLYRNVLQPCADGDALERESKLGVHVILFWTVPSDY